MKPKDRLIARVPTLWKESEAETLREMSFKSRLSVNAIIRTSALLRLRERGIPTQADIESLKSETRAKQEK